MVQCVPGPDALFAGSALYKPGKLLGSGRVGQWGNSAIYLVRHTGATPWRWVLPTCVSLEQAGGVTFLRGPATWLALSPIAITITGLHPEQTQLLRVRQERVAYNPSRHGDVPPDHMVTEGKRRLVLEARDRYPNYWVLGGEGAEHSEYSGFAIEIGEAATHQNYAQFQRMVLDHQQLDLTNLAQGVVGFTDSRGRALRLDHAGAFTRNGQEIPVGPPWRYWQPEGGGNAPIRQDWLSGSLRVQVDGAVFTCSVSDTGVVQFSNE